MKKLLSLLTCTLILPVAVANAQTPDNPPWEVYTVKDEHLSAALPALPGMQTIKEVRGRPQKDRKRLLLKVSAKGVVYTIQIVENPKPRMSLDTFIQDQTTAYPPGNLTFASDFDLEGNAGKAFVYPDGKGMAQFFATDDRLYDVRAYGAPVDDPKIRVFFSHLTLKKTKWSIEVSDTVQSGLFESEPGNIVASKDAGIKARLVKKPEPTYTDKARSEQITGTVILKCVFAADGTVTNIRVVKGLPFGLTERAIAAARQIKFVPAMKDGHNVSMWMQLEYNFNLY
jgi:TonB family protein